MKYPVYLEAICINNGHGYRYLLEGDEGLCEIVAGLKISSEVSGLEYGFKFAGYPSVVGNLPLGPIERIEIQ